MKKITITFLIIVAFLFINNSTHAQAFQKGNINFDIGFGFGLYGTSQKQTTEASWLLTPVTSDTTDGAVSRIIPISFEYGISDKIGLGFDFTYSNYYINDSDKVHLDKVSSIGFGARFNYHLLNAEKNDLMIGFGLGFSTITWNYNTDPLNPFDSKLASGSGMYWTLGITDRIFFTDNIGILFNLSYKGYNYPNIQNELTPEAQQYLANAGASFKQSLEWKMNGVNIGAGIAIKF